MRSAGPPLFDHERIEWGIEKLYYIKRIRFFLYVRLSFMQNFGRIGRYAKFRFKFELICRILI